MSCLLGRTAPVGRVFHVVTIETKAKSVVEDVVGHELRLAGVFGRQLRRPRSQSARSAIEILVVQVPGAPKKVAIIPVAEWKNAENLVMR